MGDLFKLLLLASMIFDILMLEPNLCDEKGTLQCDDYATCCIFKNLQHGCCPFSEANCCPGTDFCCPPGFSCDTNGCRRVEPS